MRTIVAEDRPFKRYEVPLKFGFDKLKEEGNKYKIDNANRAAERGAKTLSFYITGYPQIIAKENVEYYEFDFNRIVRRDDNREGAVYVDPD